MLQELNRPGQEQQLLVMGSKLQLPQGGGALTGLEENLSVSQATGMLNMTVKLPFLENRHAFNPPIALHYSSANGNGILGIGWDLGLPAIFRKTDQKIPEYRDAEDSDTFVLTGQDDLVPYLKKDAASQWAEDITSSPGLTVRRYRPRVEKDFLKIERVQSGTQTSWKVTSGTNTVTFYGLTDEGRIADPKDSRRIWKWLPQLSVDNLGNKMRFRYKKEQPDWPDQANRYLKQIQYGNAVPFYLDEAHRYTPGLADDDRFFFDIVLDYGDQDDADPGQSNPSGWPLRADAFKTFRPGFALRTERIIKRIVFFNRFQALSGDGPVKPVPVKSMDLTYRRFGRSFPETPCEADCLTAITESSWRRHPDGRLERQSLPGLTLAYADAEGTRSRSGVIRLDETSLGGSFLLCDYENEGIPGILAEKPEGLYYSANLGGGMFGPPEQKLAIPSVRGLGGRPLELGILDPGGRKFLISVDGDVPGFFEQDTDGLTLGFTPFQEVPRADPGLANRCWLDLNGDGLGELVLFGDGKIVFFPNHGRLGFGAALEARLPDAPDGEAQLIWSDRQAGLFLADMNGDGLTDIVLVSHCAVSYWPNSGYGLFGDRVQMAHAPTLAGADTFRPDRVLLADLTGTGAADLVYAGGQELVVFLNASGNAFLDGIATGLALDRAALGPWQAADLFGSGLNVLVWRCQTASGQDGFCYFDLLAGVKPYLLTTVTNPCGRQSTVTYQCATASCLADKRAGVPWVLRLPFPVFCVAATTTQDMITGLTMTRSYRYRHGSYDGYGREFNGFGLVELTESETLAWAETQDDPPAAPRLTRTWHHIGTTDEWPAVLARYEQEYFRDSSGCAPCGDPAELPVGLACGRKDANDAWRALKFAVIRQEIFGLDGTEQAAIPYLVTAASRTVRIVQPAGRLSGLGALALEKTNVQLVYERDAAHPRISRVVNIRFDEQTGMVLEQAVASFGRPPADGLPDTVIQTQNKIQTRYTVYRYTQLVDDTHYRLPQLAEQTCYELFDPAADGQEDAAALETLFVSAPPVAFLAAADDRLAYKRKLSADRILYHRDDLREPLPLGVQAARGSVCRRYSQVFDKEAAGTAYRGEIGAAQLAAAGYASSASLIGEGLFDGPDDGGWWTATEQLVYGPEPLAEFCLPRASRDFSGKTRQITYFGDDFLIMSALTDAMGFKTELTDFDMRLLRPTRLVDRNLNSTELAYDIYGFVAARALRGKGDEADRLPDGPPDLSAAEVAAFFADPSGRAAAVLGSATERFVTSYAALPVRMARIARETHQAMLPPGQPARLLIEVSYFDAFGHLIASKKRCEPGPARQLDGQGHVVVCDTGTGWRWLASGWIAANSQGQPIRACAPYYSATHDADAPVLAAAGGLTRYRYDPLGRIGVTHHPDGTLEKSVITAWQVTLYDKNDLVAASRWLQERQSGSLSGDPAEQDAAAKALRHVDTPSVQHLDARGQPVLLRSQVKIPARPGLGLPESSETHDVQIRFDAAGNRIAVTSPRAVCEEQTRYDMLGRAMVCDTADTGSRRTLYDGLGRVCQTWEGRGCQTRLDYDDLDRVTAVRVRMPDAPAWRLAEKVEYGESRSDAQSANLLGQVTRHFDLSGLLENRRFDFKGNVLESCRRFFAACEPFPDWDAPPPLSAETWETLARYNAQNRVLQQSVADGSSQTFGYDLLGRVCAVTGSVPGLPEETLVEQAEYNEQGQRSRILYANGVATVSTYDPLTWRLMSCVSTLAPGNVLQNLAYTYDPVGNITRIRDLAGETVFFANGSVSPESDYDYDSLYRLVTASGREHEGQNLPAGTQDASRIYADPAPDAAALRRYLEHYAYDLDGNLIQVRHTTGNSAGCWTQDLDIAPDANRLLSQTVGGTTSRYDYDASGQIRQMPHLDELQWNDQGLLVAAGNTGLDCRFAYDGGGRRTRKVTRFANGTVKERIYAGFLERYRESSGTAILRERLTLCFHDGDKVFAEIDFDPAGDNVLRRYRLDNHLQSNQMELDQAGRVISYEEYYPFGGTAFKATRSHGVAVPQSRYRYLGKERDEETGFYAFGLRYYAPWLGRWLSPDPKPSGPGHGLYVFAHNNPLRYADPDGGHDEDEVDGSGPGEPARERARGDEPAAEEERERPSVLGSILSSVQVLKGATLMVLGMINGDNWLKIVKKVAGVVKDLWDYLGFLSEDIANWQKNTIDTIVDFAKNRIWKPVKDFFVDLWDRIVRFFSPREETAAPAAASGEGAPHEENRGIDVDFSASVSSSGLDLTLKIGESEWTLSIGEGLKLKGKIGGIEFAYGTPWTFDELTYDYGGKVNEETGQTEGRLAKSKGSIKFSLDQTARKNATVFKMPFYWLNVYRNRAVYQGSYA